jgi:hypothetical protein
MKIKFILVIALVVLCVGGGVYYFNQHSVSNTAQITTAAHSDTVNTQSASSTTQTTHAAEDAYIVSIKGNQISYVHVDALGSKGAIAAARKDGTCAPTMSDDDCFNSFEIGPTEYDVASKTIKTALLSKDVTVTDEFQRPTSLADLKNYYMAKLDTTSGNYVGALYQLTFNNAGAVIKIDGVFRP